MSSRETIDWGIDLGTTNSSIALLEGKDVQIIKNSEGDEVTASAIYEKKAQQNVVKRIGKTAKNRLGQDPKNVAVEFKQKMGLKEWYHQFPSTQRKTTAVDLSAEVLMELMRSVKQKKGEDVGAALITVPEAFKNPMYEDTREAGKKAGLNYVELLEEPRAAALAYGFDTKLAAHERWLAYDLGGGTFDAALVKVEEGVFSIVDHEGLPYLGGKNLDAAIVEKLFLPGFPEQMRKKIKPWKSTPWWILKFKAEEAKCQLSTKNEYTIAETIDGFDFVYQFTRRQLNELEKELFAPTIGKCKELLERKKLKPKDINKVVLIGGPTLSPQLRKMIETGLDIPIDFSIDPLTAVSRGAAIYASGRKIPTEILNSGKSKAQIGKKASIHVDLHYPSTTIDSEVKITGTLEPRQKGMMPSQQWSVEINRVDKSGEMKWTSGKLPVLENGIITADLLLDEGKNKFKLMVMDANGGIVEIDRNDFVITRLTLESDIPRLSRGIGVVDAFGEVIWFFKKGDTLPNESTKLLKTSSELKSKEKGESIDIPVVEGNEDIANLNRSIDTLKIESEKVNTRIPKGSNVEVTITIDESRSLKVNAFIEDYNIEVEAIINSMLDIDDRELNKELTGHKEDLEMFKEIMDDIPEIKKVVEEIETAGIIKEIEKHMSEYSKENPEAAQRAMEKIIELRRRITAPLIEEANAVLRWKPQLKDCEHNLTTFKEIVQSASPPSDWKKEFDRLVKEYEEAVKNKDFETARDIALGGLPELFVKSEKMARYIQFREVEERNGKKIIDKISIPRKGLHEEGGEEEEGRRRKNGRN
jgi:molecular chaperone DnaK